MNSFSLGFGNIAVTPLYLVNQIFFGPEGLFSLPQNIYGAIGLLVYAMTAVMFFKYILVVLSANQNGEGGPFILKHLISKATVKSPQFILLAGSLLLFSVGLLIGDGMIIPPLSISAAADGLQMVAQPPPFPPLFIVFIIMTAFFFLQQGTMPRLKQFSGYFMMFWFAILAVTGISPILGHPEILNALNPVTVIGFVSGLSIRQLLTVLGSVLIVTGSGEVLFANLGASGRKKATVAWFLMVYPALVINFLGQGAYLLGGGLISHNNIFFSMVPPWTVYPLTLLAIAAAIAAAQSWIAMTFSLLSQAIAMNSFPRVKVEYVAHRHGGEIYLPSINWFLFLGSTGALLWFRDTASLAGAYGFATACAMLITTYAVFTVAASTWKWSFPKVVFVLIPLFLIDLLFFAAGAAKIGGGAYMAVEVALVFFLVMRVWEWGRKHMRYTIESYHVITMKDLIHRKIASDSFLPRSVIVMTPKPVAAVNDRIPSLEQLFINKDNSLPKNIIFLTVVQHPKPYMYNNRYQMEHFYKDQMKGQIVSVTLNFGFKEEPNVEKQLMGLAKHRLIAIPEHPKTWLVHVLEEHVVRSKSLKVASTIAIKLYDTLQENSTPLADYFGLGRVSGLSSEFLPVKLNS